MVTTIGEEKYSRLRRIKLPLQIRQGCFKLFTPDCLELLPPVRVRWYLRIDEKDKRSHAFTIR